MLYWEALGMVLLQMLDEKLSNECDLFNEGGKEVVSWLPPINWLYQLYAHDWIIEAQPNSLLLLSLPKIQ